MQTARSGRSELAPFRLTNDHAPSALLRGGHGFEPKPRANQSRPCPGDGIPTRMNFSLMRQKSGSGRRLDRRPRQGDDIARRQCGAQSLSTDGGAATPASESSASSGPAARALACALRRLRFSRSAARSRSRRASSWGEEGLVIVHWIRCWAGTATLERSAPGASYRCREPGGQQVGPRRRQRRRLLAFAKNVVFRFPVVHMPMAPSHHFSRQRFSSLFNIIWSSWPTVFHRPTNSPSRTACGSRRRPYRAQGPDMTIKATAA